MMQVSVLFDLDYLPTAQAAPVLLIQDFSTERRRHTERHFPVADLEVALPVRIERVGLPLNLEVAFGFDPLPHPKGLFASGRISKAPALSRFVGKVSVGDPAP